MKADMALPDSNASTFDPAEVERIARGLTKARRNMMRHCELGYGDCDNSMDGPGRRMLYALKEMGLFRNTNLMEDRHSSASYLPTALGSAVRRTIIEKDLK